MPYFIAGFMCGLLVAALADDKDHDPVIVRM